MNSESKHFRAVVRLARKRHCCDICSRVIEPGSRYEYWVGMYDYSFATMKTCEKCLKDRWSNG